MSDNAATCGSAMKVVVKAVDPSQKIWIAKERCGRCMEHSVHCATRTFISAVAQTPMCTVKKNLSRKATVEEAEDDDEEDEEEDDERILAPIDDNNGDNEDDENTQFDPKDLLGKILAFVNQVHSSPQARTYFSKLCVEENIKPLQLLKWVRTCWASLYDLITRLLDVRPVCSFS
jgi:hypothetical protein